MTSALRSPFHQTLLAAMAAAVALCCLLSFAPQARAAVLSEAQASALAGVVSAFGSQQAAAVLGADGEVLGAAVVLSIPGIGGSAYRLSGPEAYRFEVVTLYSSFDPLSSASAPQIDWGDGSAKEPVNACPKDGNGNCLSGSNTHTYTSIGTFSVRVNNAEIGKILVRLGPGAVTAEGPFDGSTIRVTAVPSLGGAIASLTWKGLEFINSTDPGRELQSAVQYNGQHEGCNPTEAGNYDGQGSETISLSASGPTLSSKALMLFWKTPPTCTGSPKSQFEKTVTIGAYGIPNVIEHDVTFIAPQTYTQAQFEALTPYFPYPTFSKFYTYDLAAKKLTQVQAAFNMQYSMLPVIVATANGQHALGIISFGAAGADGPLFGRSVHPEVDFPVSKSNCIYRVGTTIAKGPHSFTCFTVVGSVAQVTDAMDKLNAKVPHTPPRYSAGDWVKATARVLVRSTPNGTRVGVRQAGSVGTVLEGPQYVGAYFWWKVKWNNGSTGWTAQNYLTSTPPPDTSKPSVSFSAPKNNATVSGIVTLSATAADNVGVVGVQFKDGNKLLTNDAKTPYSFRWNTASTTNGVHTLNAVARDAAGNYATSTLKVTVSNKKTSMAQDSLTMAAAVVMAPFSMATEALSNIFTTFGVGQPQPAAAPTPDGAAPKLTVSPTSGKAPLVTTLTADLRTSKKGSAAGDVVIIVGNEATVTGAPSAIIVCRPSKPTPSGAACPPKWTGKHTFANPGTFNLRLVQCPGDYAKGCQKAALLGSVTVKVAKTAPTPSGTGSAADPAGAMASVVMAPVNLAVDSLADVFIALGVVH